MPRFMRRGRRGRRVVMRCVVDQDIDAAEVLRSFGEGFFDGVLGTEIDGDDKRFTAR